MAEGWAPPQVCPACGPCARSSARRAFVHGVVPIGPAEKLPKQFVVNLSTETSCVDQIVRGNERFANTNRRSEHLKISKVWAPNFI